MEMKLLAVLNINYEDAKTRRNTDIQTPFLCRPSRLRAFVVKMCFVLFLLAVVGALLPARAQAYGKDALDATFSDVVLVIDNSGSMRENDPRFLRLAAAKLFIDLADPGDKIGVVVMSGQKGTRQLTKRMMRASSRDDMAELKQNIDSLRQEPQGDETHTGTSLEIAYSMLDSTVADVGPGANQRQFVVMLTDGKPTGAGQTERVDAAAARFKERRFWKVFSIALGNDAAPEYLQKAVAEPTGAEVVVAKQASDLLNSYLDVYTRAGDDRYIERLTVQPNTLASLIDIQADQQPTQMSVVLLRGNPNASISSLAAPGGADLVQPFYQNTVLRGAEPEYDLYKVPPKAEVDLVGRWAINVAQQNPDPVQVAVLTRSKLRIRMDAPAPLREDDDTSVRYQPLGRPLVLVAGAQIAQTDPDNSDKPYVYRWITGMSPVARIVGPTAGQAVPLSDNGTVYDAVADDGRYTGLLPAINTEGDYTLELAVPRATDKPIHVGKRYTVRVTSLPTMTLTLPPGATTLPINTAIDGLIELPGRADFQIDDLRVVTAFARRPDGLLDPVVTERTTDGRFRFNYTPAFTGAYKIVIAAEVRGRGPMGQVRYIDYAEAAAAVPATVPIVAVTAAFTDTLTYNGRGVVDVPLSIDSRSPNTEQLRVQVDGMPGSEVIPAEVTVAPNEAVQRTIVVRLPAGERPKQGQFKLVLASPEQRVIVQNATTAVPFREGFDLLVPALLLLAAVFGGGFFFYRRYKRNRRVRAMLTPSAPRRVS